MQKILKICQMKVFDCIIKDLTIDCTHFITGMSHLKLKSIFIFTTHVLFVNFTNLIVTFVKAHCHPQSLDFAVLPDIVQNRIVQLFVTEHGKMSTADTTNPCFILFQ